MLLKALCSNIKISLIFLLLCIAAPATAQLITTVAGNGAYGYSGDGGPSYSAKFAWPYGVAVDNAGSFYITDFDNNVIRKVDPTGTIHTFAGSGTLGYTGDGGAATAARLYHPMALAVNNAGELFFIDQNGVVIRKIDNNGIITTVTGNLASGYAGDGGPLITAQFSSMSGLSFDAAGNMYIADWGNSVIRMVSVPGTVSTIAGNGTAGDSGDGGPGSAAQLDRPYAAVADNKGNLYIPDAGNNKIRKVNAAGIITTFAGTGKKGYTGDGGQATAATFSFPWYSTIDPTGNLYVVDALNNVVRKIDLPGVIATYAGNGTSGYTGDGGPATNAEMADPVGIACDNSGNIYVVNRTPANVVRKITNCLFASFTQQPTETFICDGGNAIFNAQAINYNSLQWQVNDGSGWADIPAGNPYTGTTNVQLGITAMHTNFDGYQYRCKAVNGCGPVYSAAVALHVLTPVTPGITIKAVDSVLCTGANVKFTAASVNGSTSPLYHWFKNGNTVGANSNTYSSNVINGDKIQCYVISGAACLTAVSAASNIITVQLQPAAAPSVTIAASEDSICFGTTITFTATPVNGGNNPQYTWFKNGNSVTGSTSTYADAALTSTDIITCTLQSSAACASPVSAGSNPVSINVIQSVTPAVNITASSMAACRGDAITFTAVGINQGAAPVFQWLKNGAYTGTDQNTYIDSTLTNGDVINCRLTADAICFDKPLVFGNDIVMQVYSNPAVQLNHTPTLCMGESRLLDAGSFNGYQWNTGATSRSITVNNTGTYSVTVTDNNTCKGSDSVSITTLLNPPAGFAPPDTAICSYGKVTLTANNGYTSYLWNNGATSPAITITQPAQYWLQVTDNNGCTAKDTIVVAAKQCQEGFYMPTAFTPNGDKTNDILKPLLFGNVKQYQFNIYNRWGQLVYQSTDTSAGWDGNTKGAKQDTNTYIWTCLYQLDGAPAQYKKGTVVLIR